MEDFTISRNEVTSSDYLQIGPAIFLHINILMGLTWDAEMLQLDGIFQSTFFNLVLRESNPGLMLGSKMQIIDWFPLFICVIANSLNYFICS